MTTAKRAETSEPAADAGGRMLAVAALSVTSFAMALNIHVFAALGPFLEPALGIGERQLGLLIATPGLAGTAGALLLGPLVDRFGRRGPLLLGTWLFALASLGYLFIDSLTGLTAVRAVTGLAGGVVFTSASAAAADLVDYGRRGRAMAWITAGMFLAIPVGMPAAVAFANAGAWRGVFWLQIGAAALAALVMAGTLPAALRRGERPAGQWTVLKKPMVVPALASVALYTGAFFSTVQFAGTWLDDRHILGKDRQGAMWIALGLGSALGSALLGRWIDRVGKRLWVLWTTAAVGVLLLLLRSVTGLTELIAVGAPLAIVSASRTAALMAFVSELVEPRMRGTLMGVRAAAVYAGMGGAALLAGMVIERSSFEQWLLCAFAGIAVAYLLVRLFVREPE